MKKPETPKKRSNEKYYPLVFLVLFPLTGGSAAMEYGLFGGSIGNGVFWGAVAGFLLYGLWRVIQKRRQA